MDTDRKLREEISGGGWGLFVISTAEVSLPKGESITPLGIPGPGHNSMCFKNTVDVPSM
jgi:hypothetical protein